MKNSIFKFKQFKVEQSQAAAKIGTDGVLIGAWANLQNAENILDVGTGTGVIALMAAQRSNAEITAAEIEKSAYETAVFNFKQSKWKNRLSAEHVDFKEFANTSIQKFDYIISNPPFFENAFKSADTKRQTARHTDSLSFNDLIKYAGKLLTKNGIFGLIIPADTADTIIKIAEHENLFCIRKCLVKPNHKKAVKRIMLEFGFNKSNCKTEYLTIEEDKRHCYTKDYIKLTSEFYLKM